MPLLRSPLGRCGLVASILWLAAGVACSPRTAPSILPSPTSAPNNSWMDLAPGNRIRVVIPLEGVAHSLENSAPKSPAGPW